MKIALAQMNMTDRVEDNLRASVHYMEQAHQQQADLIFFPELQLSPFFPSRSGADASRYLLPMDSEEILTLRQACCANQVAASINVYLRENGHNYDASLTIDRDGSLLGIAKMVHVASFPHFYEAEYYTPSDTGFQVYDLPVAGRICKIGIVICFDRHFPESIRSCALQGADLILIPTANLTEESEDMFLWELRVQAMQNGVSIAMCNRVGNEGDITFCGHSVVVDSQGEVLSYADGKEGLLIQSLTVGQGTVPLSKSMYLSARRPEKYQILTERRAVSLPDGGQTP